MSDRLLALAALVLPLSVLSSCASSGRRIGGGEPFRGSAEGVLSILRERTVSTATLVSQGTMLLQWDAQKQFVHFRAHFRRPDLIRFDLDMSGPLGLGSGRLVFVGRGDTLEVLLPGEKEPVRGLAGSPTFDFLDTRGLPIRDGIYLIAPYCGAPELFAEANVVAFGNDRRTGGVRLVLSRPDGNREVLLLEPDGLSLVERRVARRDGTVLLVCHYSYGDDRSSLAARKVDNWIPKEESFIKVRFRKAEINAPAREGLFRCSAEIP